MDPLHGRAKAGRPARTYIQQLCEDTGCCPEDLPRAMNDREEWRERVRDIRATSAIWWWWWYIYVHMHICMYVCMYVFYLYVGISVCLCVCMYVCMYRWIRQSICHVGWGCRKYRLLLCTGVRPPPTSVLDMTQKIWWSGSTMRELWGMQSTPYIAPRSHSAPKR